MADEAVGAAPGAVTVVDARRAQRFEAWVGGRFAGAADYRRGDLVVVYPHTEVEPGFEDDGIVGALARAALDDARARGLRVRIDCPLLAAWTERHPDRPAPPRAAGGNGGDGGDGGDGGNGGDGGDGRG